MRATNFFFFVKYYFKKHIGKFIFNQSISDNDIFWKRYFRTARKIPLSIESVSADEHIITSTDTAGNSRKVHVRSGGSSDIKVFDQIFLEKEYQPLIEQIKKRKVPVKFIIDAGANVGYTSVVLQSAFPGSNLICIEPSSANAKQIEKNFSLNSITNYQLIEAGLWSKNCWLTLKSDESNDADWAFYVVESDTDSGLKAITLQSVLEKYHLPYIDILKIDIEGSEEELFNDEEAMKKILQQTKFLAMEIHDHVAKREHIYEVLRSVGFEYFESGELVIATNKVLVNPSGH